MGARGGEGRRLVVHEARNLAVGGQSTAIVLSLRTVRSHLKRCGRDLDGACTLGDLEVGGHVNALRVDDHEVVDVRGHAVGHVSSRRIRYSALDGIALRQAGDGHVNAVSLAVIGSAVVAGGRNDLISSLSHRKGAELLGDSVVTLLGGIARSGPINGIGVGAGVDLGLGARGGEGSGLAVDEAGDSTFSSERLAVVDLGSAGRSNSQLSRNNLVRTGHGADVVTLAGHCYGHGAHVGLVSREGQVVVGAFDQGLLAVLDLRLLHLFGAAVDNVMQIANRHVGSSNALAGNGQGAVVLRLDVVIAFLGSTPFDDLDLVDRGANLGLGAFGLGSRALFAHKAIDGAARGERIAVVDLAVAVGINRKRSRRNLIGLDCGAGVVADARNGHLNGLGIGEIGRVVGNRVISAFDQRFALGIFDLGGPLMTLAVINGIGRIANSSTRVALGVLGIGHDGLSRHRKGAKVLGQNIVIVRSAFFELVRDGVIARANHSLGAGRMNPAVADEVGPNEAGVITVRTHVDPILDKRRAIVDLGSACGSQLNVALLDGKGLLGVLIAGVVGGRGTNLNCHRACINRRNHRRVATPLGVRRALNAVFKAHISASDRSARTCRTSGMRLGIVSVFGIVGRDGQIIIRRQRSDGELALVLGDVVVARLEVGTLIVSDGVGNLTLGDCGHGASSADVGDLAVNKTVTSHSDIGPGKRSAIVGLRVCHAFENHRALENLVFHVGAAGVVALTGHGNGNGADVSSVLAVRKRVVNVLRQSLIPVLNDGLLLLRLAVVRDVCRSLHRHVLASLDILGRDVQLTIDNHERNLGEVLVVVGEVARLELHVVGADVCTLDSVVAAKGEVGFLVQLIRCREFVARDRLLGAIVLNVTAVLGNSDDDLVLVSGHNEFAALGGNPVVGLAGTFVEGIVEGVIAFALLGLGTSNAEGNAFAVDKANTFTLGGCGDGAVGKRSSVIRLVAALGSQRHKTLGNRNALGVGSVLALCVVGAGSTQLHGLETKVGNRDLGRVARPGLAINAVFDIQGIAIFIGRSRSVSGKRRAIIGLLIVVRVPHNTILVDLAALDLEPAVLNNKLNVGEVVAGVGELILGKVHVVGANCGTLSGSIAREFNVAPSVEAVIDREVIANHGLLGAVVGLGVLVTLDGDGDRIGNRVHLQSAVLGLGEDVVVRARISVKRISIGVFRLANVGDGAGVGKGRALAVGKAGHILHLMLGVLVAVVGPLVRSRLHRDGRLIDDERAVFGRDLKLVRHVVALGILHHCGASNVIRIGASVGRLWILGGEARDGVLVAANRKLISLDTSGGVLLAVIGSLARVGLDHDLVLGVTVGDGQRTLSLGDVVVIRLGVFVQRVAEGVSARADNSLRPREGIGRALTLGETGNLKRSLALATIFVREGRTVVGLGEIGGLQGRVCLGDVDVTVGHVKGDVGKVGCICIGEFTGQAHLGLAGIGTSNLAITRERNFVPCVVLVVRCKGIALGRKLFAVVDTGCSVTNDGNRNRVADRLNSQSSVGSRYLIVVGVRALSERIGEGVVTRAGVGLGTGHMSREALALRKAVARDGNIAVGERGAIVGLFIGCGS